MKLSVIFLLLISQFITGCSLIANKPQPASSAISTEAEPNLQQRYASFKPETLYALLVAETANLRGRPDIALATYLEQAKTTRDPAIAERATHLAEYLQMDDSALSAALFWVEIAPEQLEARQFASLHLIKAGRFEEAIQHLDYILSVEGEANFDYLIAKAKTVSTNERTTLISILNQLIARYPANAQLWLTLALLQHHDGQLDAALHSTEQALKHTSPYPQAIILKADILYQLERKAEALKVLKQAVKEDPQQINIRLFYTRMLIKEQEFSQAKKQFAALSEQFPNDNEMLLSLALLCFDTKFYEQANQYFHALIGKRQYLNEAYFYLGKIAQEQKQYQKAIEYFSKVAVSPSYVHAQAQIAFSWEELGELKKAREHLALQRLIVPDKAMELYLAEIDILANQEAYQAAYDLLTQALEKYQDDLNLLYVRAMMAEKINRLDWLERDLRKVLSLTPNNAPALNALGYTLANRTDRYEEALALIKHAIQLNPNDPAFIDSLGWVNYHMGNYEAALQHLQKAYSLFPDAEIAAHLGEVLWKLGKIEEARALWDKSLKENPDSPILKETRERFIKNN